MVTIILNNLEHQSRDKIKLITTRPAMDGVTELEQATHAA